MANAAAPSKPVRRSIKAATGKSGQQKRRDEALQRQQAARQDFADHARQLASLAVGSSGGGGGGVGGDQVLLQSTTAGELIKLVDS